MRDLAGITVAVAGAGILGLASSLALARAGARVTLFDPAPLGDNASGIAAGMLAPAMEAVLDPVSADHFDLYRRARDAWATLIEGVDGARLDRSGALWRAADPDEAAEIAARLRAVGAAVEVSDTAEGPAVFTPEDWRLEPATMLAALAGGFAALGGTVRRDRLAAAGSAPVLASGARLSADAVVIAPGFADEGLRRLAPELAVLTPIKGQILQADGGPRSGPVVRGTGVYVVPGEAGALIGATMQAGANDRAVDPAVTAELMAAATRLFPDMSGAGVTARAGVRAATPDGLPLAGASRGPRVFLAAGARRNGWLLAPLVAEAVASAIAGDEAETAFAPGRFG